MLTVPLFGSLSIERLCTERGVCANTARVACPWDKVLEIQKDVNSVDATGSRLRLEDYVSKDFETVHQSTRY